MKSDSAKSILPAAITLAGGVGILLATPHGIGLSPDSIGYVGGAGNMIDGKGFSMPHSGEPITHRAPLCSIPLATVALIGLEPVPGARWLAAAFFGLNIILMWWLASQTCGEVASGPVWVPAEITGLELAAPTMWEIHLMAWTEPVYISVCRAGLWRTAAYVIAACRRGQPRTCGRHPLCGTLHVGHLLPGGDFLAEDPWSAGLRTWAFSRRLVLGLFVVWAGRNLPSAGTATNRPVTFHPIGKDHFREALGIAASWLMVPEDASGRVKVAVIAALGAAMVAGI